MRPIVPGQGGLLLAGIPGRDRGCSLRPATSAGVRYFGKRNGQGNLFRIKVAAFRRPPPAIRGNQLA
jgi:hypothetical protein